MGTLTRRSSKLWLTLGVVLLLCAGLLWGLSGALAASGSPSPAPGKVVLRVGYVGEPDSLNPFVAQVFTSYMIFALDYDQLVGIDAATLAPSKQTGLAQDWSVSPDGLTWTFTLRHDATWQDNHQPVTASDVAFTYNYVIDNQMENFVSYVQGIRHATAVDPHTVRMECSKPKADMLLACNSVPIVPEHIWSKINPKAASDTYPNNPPIVGSGPFQCTAYKKSSYVVMTANKSYWRGAPKVDEVLLQCYTNEYSMAEELQSGALDCCTGLLNAQLRLLAGKPGITAKPIRTNGYDDLVFNCYVPPAGGTSLGNPVLRDWQFRQALQWAIDKQKIVQVVYAGYARPGDTVITGGYYTNPDWHWTPPADQAYSFNLTRASDLLTAAGYPLRNGVRLDKQGKPITLRLWTRTSSQPSQLEGKLIAGWLGQLGLKIKLATMDNGALLNKIFNSVESTFAPDYDMFVWGWYNSIDPGQSVSYFCTDQINGWSDSAYSNLAFDKLFVQQSRTIDTAKRKQLLDQMQQIIYQQSPYVVLAYYDDFEAWNTGKWTGWVRSPAGYGNVVNQTSVIATYLFVGPATASAATTSGGNSSVWLLVGIAAAVVVAVIVVVLRRRRRRSAEETL